MRCPRASSEAELMSEAGSGVHVPSTGRPFHSVFETKFTFFTGFYKMKPRSCKILRAARRGGGAAQACGHQLRSPAAIFFPQHRYACPPPVRSTQHRSRVSARAARSGGKASVTHTSPIKFFF